MSLLYDKSRMFSCVAFEMELGIVEFSLFALALNISNFAKSPIFSGMLPVKAFWPRNISLSRCEEPKFGIEPEKKFPSKL